MKLYLQKEQQRVEESENINKQRGGVQGREQNTIRTKRHCIKQTAKVGN